MKALIMAAGYGTRLEPLTLAVPKPMVPIVNKPCMQHNLELLRRNGIHEAAVNIHYHPEQIMNYFEDGDEFGVSLIYSFEETLLGTAGGVLRMAELLGGLDDAFLVLSSDALTDINLRHMIAFHKKKKALATLALASMPDPSHFGVVTLDQNEKITAFMEKPKKEEAPGNLVNTGIYIFEPEILKMIPKGKFHDFGRELFPKLIAKKAPVYGYQMIGYWSDVGGLDAYIRANYEAMKGDVRVFIPGKKISSYGWAGKNSQIDESVKFDGCVIIGDRAEIRRGARLKDVVLGDRCVVGENSVINGSIIWSDSSLSKNSRIEKSVIGNWCRLGEGVEVQKNSIISNRCQIGQGIRIPEDTRLKPNEIL
ncbi:MAG: NDP-sugar synthase [Candidatus Margulisiibacteriota bacterium]